jgi:hypothetical protein
MPQHLQISGSRAIIFIRLMVGIVFLSEGIQKFLYPAELGAGRFAKIGIPSPALMGPFVGVAEIVCGTLILTGFFIRFAAAVMLINISVALDETADPARTRGRTLLSPEAPQVRRLELAARGARGSLHVARGALPDPGFGAGKGRWARMKADPPHRPRFRFSTGRGPQALPSERSGPGPAPDAFRPCRSHRK